MAIKCGLEIHQRLSGKKLFCNCPAHVEGVKSEGTFSRKLAAAKSELGKADIAVSFEVAKEKTFEYSFSPESACLVEADEEPPHGLNDEALSVVVALCKSLGSTLVDEVHVMRKIVIDGSNTTGFQRTAIVGMGGKLSTSKGDVRISTVCIEEESCAIGEEGKTSFSLDRLGIPLIEIATEPDVVDAAHAKETALAIGTLLRMSGAVQRGIGTIRQDVNVSVDGGKRVEIKGLQELGMMETLVQKEEQRQRKLAQIGEEVQKRSNGKFSLGEQKIVDVSEIFLESKCALVKKGMQAGGVVLGICVPFHAGLLGKEVYEGRRYGSEVSDYAKAAGVRGIIHSDEDMEKYGISEDEVTELRFALSCKKEDAFVLVVAKERVAQAALSLALKRLEGAATLGETRRAHPDGSSSFMRPLAGGARMYPETDVEPIRIDEALLKKAGKIEIESPQEKLAGLCKLLPEHMAKRMLMSRNLGIFERIVGEGIEPMLAATVLEDTLVALRRENVPVEKISEEKLTAVFEEYKNGAITKAAIGEVLRAAANEPEREIGSLVVEKGLAKITGEKLAALVKSENAQLGQIMAKYRLRVDAAEVQKLLKKG